MMKVALIVLLGLASIAAQSANIRFFNAVQGSDSIVITVVGVTNPVTVAYGQVSQFFTAGQNAIVQYTISNGTSNIYTTNGDAVSNNTYYYTFIAQTLSNGSVSVINNGDPLNLNNPSTATVSSNIFFQLVNVFSGSNFSVSVIPASVSSLIFTTVGTNGFSGYTPIPTSSIQGFSFNGTTSAGSTATTFNQAAGLPSIQSGDLVTVFAYANADNVATYSLTGSVDRRINGTAVATTSTSATSAAGVTSTSAAGASTSTGAASTTTGSTTDRDSGSDAGKIAVFASLTAFAALLF